MGFAVNRRSLRLITPTLEGFSWVGELSNPGKPSIADSLVLVRLGGDPMNDLHKRALVTGCRDLHNRLAEMESMLVQAGTGGVFSEYVNDLQPADQAVLRDYFARLRQALEHGLTELGIPIQVRRRSVRWWLQCATTFLNVCLAEMAPSRLRGYGALSAQDVRQLEAVQADWQRWIGRIADYLRQPPFMDLSQRLASAPERVRTLLASLQQMILRYDLVEYLPLWQALVTKLASPRLEVAVFGRVNSGKSSLLNSVIGRAILPVGVTPVTAVPTRVQAGEQDCVLVYFAEVPPRTVPLSELAEYATEQHNPNNAKHVTEIVVSLKSERLAQGIVLIDTPGLGSLTDAGAQQSLAYLPRCELGLVLVEATASLSPTDLHLLALLNQAGVPSQVLLSKADLLAEHDRPIVLEYVRQQLQQHLGRELPVYLVSTKQECRALLDSWLQQDLLPILAQLQAHLQALLVRKAVRLAENVAQFLELRLRQGTSASSGARLAPAANNAHHHPDDNSKSPQASANAFGETELAILNAQRSIQNWLSNLSGLVEDLIGRLTAELVQARLSAGNKTDTVVLAQLQQGIHAFFRERGQAALQLAENCRQALVRVLSQLNVPSPARQVDTELISNWRWQGLPIWEVPDLPVGHLRPWWTRWAPRLATSVIRQRLRRRLGHTLQQLVETYERQLQAWLKTQVGQLIHSYEDQIAVTRVWQTWERAGPSSNSLAETAQIETDLTHLRALLHAD